MKGRVLWIMVYFLYICMFFNLFQFFFHNIASNADVKRFLKERGAWKSGVALKVLNWFKN